jgi:hypothetical protein
MHPVMTIAQAQIQLTSAINNDEIDSLIRNFDLASMDDGSRKSQFQPLTSDLTELQPALLLPPPPVPGATCLTTVRQIPGQIRPDHAPPSLALYHDAHILPPSSSALRRRRLFCQLAC